MCWGFIANAQDCWAASSASSLGIWLVVSFLVVMSAPAVLGLVFVPLFPEGVSQKRDYWVKRFLLPDGS